MTQLQISSNLKFNENCISSLYVELLGIIDDEKQDNLSRINAYLQQVVKILNQERIFTKNSWKLIGKDLFIFSKIYSKMLTVESCSEDYKKLIGIGKEWTMYLCLRKPPTNYRPFRLLYKLLGFIGILYTKCIYFYSYDSSRKNNDVQLLTLDDIFKHMYDPRLRFSKSNVQTCINNQNDIVDLITAKEYIGLAIHIRDEFLKSKYCGEIFKTYKIDANSELKHDYFVENLKIINSQITRVIENAREN